MTTQALPSQTEPVVDRYRRWNPVWYRWFKPLLDQVRTNVSNIATAQAEITQTTETLVGYGARWTLSLNVGGAAVGWVTLDGDGTGTSFRVVTDKFSVESPTATGTMQPFTIGLVDGVSTVGINGELVVDGSITADKLNVNTLDEATDDAGIIVNGTLRDAANTYEFVIEDGYFGRTDGSSYIDMKNNELQFTT